MCGDHGVCLWSCGQCGASQSCSGSGPILPHTPVGLVGFFPVDPVERSVIHCA